MIQILKFPSLKIPFLNILCFPLDDFSFLKLQLYHKSFKELFLTSFFLMYECKRIIC
jgi:hypothetical protein